MRLSTSMTSTVIIGLGFIAALSIPPLVAQEPSAAAQAEPAMQEQIATVNVEAEFIDIEPHIGFETATLRIAGPNGYALTRRVSGSDELYVTADLLLDARERLQSNEDPGMPWEQIPDGTYRYELVLHQANGEIHKVQGQFFVEHGQARKPSADVESSESVSETSDDSQTLLQRVAGATLSFLVPSAHAQQTFTDDIEISKSSPRLIFDSDLSTGDNWRIRGDTASWQFRDQQNSNTVMRILPGAGNEGSLTIDGSGNVGVGTTAPQDTFHVQGFGIQHRDWRWTATDLSLYLRGPDTGSSGMVQFFDAPTGSLVIRDSGNVGLGTTSPAARLHVAGDGIVDTDFTVSNDFMVSNNAGIKTVPVSSTGLYVRGDTTNILRARPDGQGTAFVVRNNGSVSIGSLTDGPPGGLYVDGDVGLGTSSPLTPLHVGSGTTAPRLNASAIMAQQAGDTGLTFRENAEGVEVFLLAEGSGTIPRGIFGTLDAFPFEIRTNNANRFWIAANGNIGIGGVNNPSEPIEHANGAVLTSGGAWQDASSRDLKENISPLNSEEALRAVMDLKPVQFQYKIDDDDHRIGFIAEEVPELVAAADRKSLSSMEIVAAMVQVVQRQQQQIEDLKLALQYEAK